MVGNLFFAGIFLGLILEFCTYNAALFSEAQASTFP